MASPTTNGTPSSANTTTAGTSFPLTMPTGIVAGELLLVLAASKAIDASAAMAGWTRFFDVANAAGSNAALSGFWKVAAGGDTGTLTATSTRLAYIVYRIGGAENPATQPPEATTGTTANTNAPNPPAITPTGGSKDYLFLAAFCSSAGRITSADPAGYTNGITSGSNSGTVTHVGIGAAQKAATASSEDPAAFTTTAAGTEETAFATIAIHPAAAAAATSLPPTRSLDRIRHLLIR